MKCEGERRGGWKKKKKRRKKELDRDEKGQGDRFKESLNPAEATRVKNEVIRGSDDALQKQNQS